MNVFIYYLCMITEIINKQATIEKSMDEGLYGVKPHCEYKGYPLINYRKSNPSMKPTHTTYSPTIFP